MSVRSGLVLTCLLASACGAIDGAPPSDRQSLTPEVLYAVHQEVLAIHLDGTGRRSLGRVGDDRHRTGYPRFLPDGRVAVMADDTGQIFPFVAPHEGGSWTAIRPMNVTVNDSLCGVVVGGTPRLIFTMTPFVPTHTTIQLVDLETQAVSAIKRQSAGVLFDPSPYEDGRVLVVRGVGAETTIGILDVSRPSGSFEAIHTVMSPLYAMSPVRLPDGRIAYIRVDSRDLFDSPIGEIQVIGLDGTSSPARTGLTDAAALVVAGRYVVYERVSPTTGLSQILANDLSGAPSLSVTNSPYVSQHLGWSD